MFINRPIVYCSFQIIASLPQKVLNLLEFIGFHGDEATGERLLMEQVESFEGFMAVLSCCALLIYQTYLYYIFGNFLLFSVVFL